LKRFKTVVIGCGAISEMRHIPAAIKLPEIDLIALLDHNVQRAKVLANKYGIKEVYKDLKAVLDKVDIAIVATPNSSHCQISCQCLKRGVHVLCEKPMAKSANECESMIRASELSNAKLMVGHYMRFTSNVGIAKQMITDSILGNLTAIDFSFGQDQSWPSVTRFYDCWEISGGGVLIDYGVHLIDLLHWLTTEEPRLKNYRVYDKATSKIEKDVEVEFQLQGGAKCLMNLSWTKKLPNAFQLYGDKGWLKIDLNNYQELELYKDGERPCSNGESVSIVGEKCDPYLRQLECFVQSINGGQPPPTSGIDGLRTLKVVEACYHSLPREKAKNGYSRQNRQKHH
jgi:predicted dehydrogenase